MHRAGSKKVKRKAFGKRQLRMLAIRRYMSEVDDDE
jgi:hypothetical protein